MKLAPNVKELPKDKGAEAVIFAGSKAWEMSKKYQKKNSNGDAVPPIVLDHPQLCELENLHIIDRGRMFARVYQAGTIDQASTSLILQKLYKSKVKQAQLFDEAGQLVEDWTPRLKDMAENPLTTIQVRNGGEINLIQMGDNEKALLLASRYEGIAIHTESEAVYLYREGVWEKASPLELSREMVAIYNENQTNFNKRTINNVIDALKLVIPEMGEPKLSLIPFSNGIYDIETGMFSEHSADNWLSSHNGVEYTPPAIGENLRDHAPNFHKWLSHAADSDALKMRRIAAALFMVLANRFDWQLFLEITGDGGSGKSVFTQVATLLAGKNNTASGNMAALDDAGGRAQFAGKRLITLPDQPKYTGEGTGIKAITGGDAMEINPKYEKQYTAVLRAVVIATNNTPMIFTERSGGVSRRRVIFQFNNLVREDERDPDLAEKISAEIPVIVRRLLVNFFEPDKARQLLLEQRDSLEALEVKRASNPVIDLCAALAFMGEPRGLEMGGGKKSETDRQPRKYLYHLYLEFMEYMGLSRPLSVTEFGKAVKEAAKEYGGEYKTRTVNGRRQTNVEITDKADEFL